MKYKGMWSRWHRFDKNGAKYIRKFGINETPNPLIEPGYTEWRRGTGPLEDEHYKNVTNGVRNACLGVPKTEEQKHKMSLAKLGVPKSEEHRKAMSDAWKKKRQAKYQQVYAELKTNNG